jgi:uncharacterized protein YecE (DUF72 family)
MLYIGTSGFSYQDWIGPFYPENTEKGDMLTLYAKQFNTVEINSSYYRIIPAAIFFHLERKVPADFKFVVKANQVMTHIRDKNEAVFQEFESSLQPILKNNKLGCVLAQFPYSFHYNSDNLDYLLYVKERIDYTPLIVEFRNNYWVKDLVFDFLKKNEIGFCMVDQPPLKGLISPITVVTSPLGYIRFHGRNKEKWWQHEHAYQRYDYLYSEQELEEWVPRIKQIIGQSNDQYIFMNNHYKGKATKNALMLMRLLRQEIKITDTTLTDIQNKIKDR